LYATGRGVAKDEARAVQLYQAAADQGLAAAQRNLGAMYAYGEGVAKDEARAAELYQAAADQGDADAQCALGLMYANGRGVAKDEARAVELFQAAADQGHAGAQFELGVVYEEGSCGEERDFSRAMKLFQRAAAQGHAEARQRRDRLAPPRDGAAPSVVTSAPGEVGDGLLADLDCFGDADEAEETRDDAALRMMLRGGFSLGSEPPSLPVMPLPEELPASRQGAEGTCMCHAVVRVVCSQLQHKYGKSLHYDAAVEALIQRTNTHTTNSGLDIDAAVAALSELHLQSEDKGGRYQLRVTCETYDDFDQLVHAVRNSQGVQHIVTGTEDHAVVADSVEETRSGANRVLCIDSQDGHTSRLGRFASRGAPPTSQFFCFHVVDTVVVEVMEGGTKRKRVPGILTRWAQSFGTTADDLKRRLGLLPSLLLQ
jgi:hypothetical protein